MQHTQRTQPLTLCVSLLWRRSLLSVGVWTVGMLYPIVLEEKGVSTADEYWLMIQWATVEPIMLLCVFYFMSQHSVCPFP